MPKSAPIPPPPGPGVPINSGQPVIVQYVNAPNFGPSPVQVNNTTQFQTQRKHLTFERRAFNSKAQLM